MEFRCKKCNKFLGEMYTGKIHKDGMIGLCTECYESYKTFESLCNLRHGDKKAEMPEFMKDIFGKFNEPQINENQ